ncbi:MAG: ribosome-associated translation inhibitor RaiA [Bacteroidetes bacterium SB0662_bin_6]|nr:ribosome-associated translation inhibitor RaiA [Bacteroidetes bacterium SB0668_bin_1]MYE05168.1 ribosome-associated translation inhibitor RaiA [Bacteroidetes bacterium SB0662_bin_6]
MQTQITARHFDAPSTLREYAETRLAKLERVYDGITEARIVLSENGHPDKIKTAEMIVHVYHQTLTAASDGATHEEAVDECAKILRRRLKKYKARLRSTNRNYQK